ncbi:MAG: YabP/YqfC family sporulation protein [Clostridia bacterium]|nr:YabP/YqfC family sporulation protein [Clostridia bacterium]
MADNGDGKRVRVEGAKKLLLCLEKEIKILLCDEILHFVGEGLSCTAYASGALEVAGTLFEIRFECNAKGGRGR